MIEIQEIKAPLIRLEWSDWYQWNAVAIDGRDRNSIKIPKGAGVYEVARDKNSTDRLTIGKATNLQRRVRSGLVNGTAKHSSGTRIRGEDTNNLLVRWAITEHPACAEEQLHKLYKKQHNGSLPLYTKVT